MSKNKDFYKQCKGCRSYSQMLKKPNCSVKRIPYIPEGLVCPCSICLVKCMCINACNEFEEFIYLLKETEKNLFRGDNDGYKNTL